MADTLRRHPGGTLPDKLNEPAELKAFYRLCNCDDVTHEAILAPHCCRTLQSLEGLQRHLLVLHDTTELDYTTLESLENLGKIGNGRGRGYQCHNSLVVEPTTRAVVGLASQILHRRADVPKHEKKGAGRARATRESRLWLRGTEHLPAVPWLVDVCDRGADTFEFLEYECHNGRRFLIRSAYNRQAFVGHTETAHVQQLHEIVRRASSLGTRKINLSSTPDAKDAPPNSACLPPPSK